MRTNVVVEAVGHSTSWPLLVQSFATLLIAGFVAFVAWRQKELAAAKVRLELFDKRLEIYNQMRSAFSKDGVLFGNFVLSEFTSSLPDLNKVRFLFGDEVADYQERLLGLATTLWHLKSTSLDGGGLAPSGRVGKVVFEFNEAVDGIGALFRPFLDFSKL